MIDAKVPVIPNNSEDVTDPKQSVTDRVITFARQWYTFFNDGRNFMLAVRNAPKQIEQANLAKYGIKLGRLSSGVQVWVPEFNHMLRWTGTSWSFAPGDNGSAYTVGIVDDPPTGDGWVVCDGSTVTFLNADGTTGSKVLPVDAARYFRR